MSNVKYLQLRYRDLVIERGFFQVLARYLLLASLFYGPWAFGSTLPIRVDLLDDGLLFCFGLHVVGLALEGRRPRYPLLPTGCLVLLILQSSWMIFNARSYLDDEFWEFVPLAQAFPDLAGSWDKAGSLFALKTLCAMSAAFLVASDFMVEAVWRLRLWRTIAIAGCSVILYGLIQKVMGQDSVLSMYHEPANVPVPTFFGPYRYHANAGAYLNLVWPVLLALFVHSWRDRDAHVGRAIWSCALVMGIAACFVNTSKAAAAIAVLMLATAVVGFAGFFWNNLIRSRIPSRVLAGVFLLGLITILIYGGSSNNLQDKWNTMFKPGDAGDINGRLIVQGVCLQMIPEAGSLGFGPGTFSKVFPFHTLSVGDQIPGFWIYAHEDYLQTVVEYGYWGTVFWSVLFFGGILKAIQKGLQPSFRTNDRVIYRACALALGGVALHSLVDFPLQIASLQLYVMMFLAYAWSTGGGGKTVSRASGKPAARDQLFSP